ncbi:hypothetical protein U6B65_14695 (plasmid) [Oscillospiraceae bacterium MB08-C2-2]|nr:hypothetical protein U6B65_14695 [Oscillospiraceae bacterium MB08-C2-2]
MNTESMIQSTIISKDFYEFVMIQSSLHYIPKCNTGKYVQRMEELMNSPQISLSLSKKQKEILVNGAFNQKQLLEILYGFWIKIDDVVEVYATPSLSSSEMSDLRELYDFYNCTIEEISSCITQYGRFSYSRYQNALHQGFQRTFSK